jgi:hypothetical protein
MKLNLDNGLYDRAKVAAEKTGYSSVDEFVAHAVERELERLKLEQDESVVTDRLRGLGYIE